ncbi:hypothetical protein PFICI_03230 [Pestalotiopsis fici W106-1]|uniref:C2H2-type domain-containing protein n=1 Tax=Pestalotiopsis fici (strain W106-1 / CGMCC3.15140) TaxID=1229662 RepID=W3XGP7_PESFW|nr:uncharacterized protein PFICI_03230 [Pestalotiopsis fici W106-1]ETS85205.1 hypothetical protein PFICI_03230 [Pestalotiopsis fici W106-1]
MRPSRNPPAPPAAAVPKDRRGQQWPHPEAGPSIYAHDIPFQAQASHNPTALACPGPETVFAPAHFQDLDVVSAPFPWPSAPPRPAAHVQPHQLNSTCGPASWACEHDSDGNTTGTIRPWENDIVATSDRTEAPGGARPRVANIEPSASGSHICLWGMDGPCKDGPFTTREALNWHVKAAHLLTCPVLGCTEGVFAVKKLVEVHLRWQHKLFTSPKDQELHQSSDLLNETAEQTPMAAEAPSTAPAPPRQPKCEDKRLKMELTVATSKKRCRDQLRAVVERRCRRVTATPRSMDSPGTISASTPRAGGAVPFPVIWEHGVLPFLIELMPKWCGAGHVITVTRGKKREARRVCIMTARPISKARKVVIAGHVRDLLPDNYKGLVSFVFSVGAVERLTWARGLSKDMPDEICQPRNPFCYVSPQMGDSIGMTLPDGDDTSATLGPCIKIGGAWFWLANFHPFEEVDLTRHCAIVEHPSPEDRDRCVREKHDALEGPGVDLHLGQLTATSGYDLKTTRITHEPYWEDCDKEPPLVVTDWALISSQKQQANMMRKFPSTATPQREEPITRMCSVAPGAEVCATGRTSGYQRGLICEIPAYIDGRKNGTGKATREWFIEEPFECEDEDSWIRGGIGVAGDSGAGVVDCDTNALVGQLWGRNKYFGPGPRVAFFTPIFDVFDDIQERCGQQTRPQLPQNIQEAERWPAYPVCRPCFDVQEYMATRRSSRESLVSMIPAVEISGDADHELRTISELATPRDSSFGSVVSPAPVMSTFFYQPHVPSPRPGIFEITSPYAMDIRDEDLEDGIGDSPYAGLGKRQSGSAALVRSSSQQSAKRRRIM